MSNENINQDLLWLQEQLAELPDPELPSSLSAASLFEKMDTAEADTPGADPDSNVTKLPFDWKRWRPALSAAAVIVLVAVVYLRGSPIMLNNATPDTVGTEQFGAAFGELERSVDEAAPETAMDDMNPATGGGGEPDMGENPPTGGGNPDSGGEGAEGDSQGMLMSSVSAVRYEEAMENVVLDINLAQNETITLTEVYTQPAELYEKADLVVTAYMSPSICVYWELPETRAEVEVVSAIKGNAQPQMTIAYLGGVASVQDTLAAEALPAQKLAEPPTTEALMAEYSLTPEEMETGYVYTNVGNRVWLEGGQQYVLFLVQGDKGWRLIESEYAVLAVDEAGWIYDYYGEDYGTTQEPSFIQTKNQ